MLLPMNDPRTRPAALDAAWESMQGRTAATRLEFDTAAMRADVHPVVIDGAIQGAVLTLGPEVHACVKLEAFGRWLGRPALRIVRDLVARYGHATTSTMAGCDAGAQFVRRLGFQETGRQAGAIQYELTGAHRGL